MIVLNVQKSTLKATGLISIISLIICARHSSAHDFVYDLSMTIFGSALVSMVIAFVSYSKDAEDDAKEFFHVAYKAYKVMDGARPIDYEDDDEKRLIIEAIKGSNEAIEGLLKKYSNSYCERRSSKTKEELNYKLSCYRDYVSKNIAQDKKLLEIDFTDANRPPSNRILPYGRKFNKKGLELWEEAVREQQICQRYVSKLFPYLLGKMSIENVIESELELEDLLFVGKYRSNPICVLYNELWTIYDGEPLPGR